MTTPDGRSITPATPVKLSLTHVLLIAGALLAAGAGVGALYPRLAAVETAVERQGRLLELQAEALRRVERGVDRLTVVVEQRSYSK